VVSLRSSRYEITGHPSDKQIQQQGHHAERSFHKPGQGVAWVKFPQASSMMHRSRWSPASGECRIRVIGQQGRLRWLNWMLGLCL
jgi:hypothetical protein